MTSTELGERTEAIVLGYLIRSGLTVCMPFGNAKRYDFVVDYGEKLERMQCKTGRLRAGCVCFNTCSIYNRNGKRKAYHGQIEAFVVYCQALEKVYKVPVSAAGATNMMLRVEPPKNGGHQKTIKWAKDFEI